MELTEDAFRALARSSPWRWRNLHFARHGSAPLRAWVRRPGELRVIDAAGRSTVERETLEDHAGVLTVVAEHGEPSPRKPRVVRRWPHEVEPVRRTDGLVARRPEEIMQEGNVFTMVEYGDPMHLNYQWVAMLDPVELSAGTSVSDLAAGQHHGRPVWEATMTALDGYDPTCSCCPLLWSAVSDALEFGSGHQPDRPYPESYRVALDVETGVVVRLREAGADEDDIDLEIAWAQPWT